MEYKGELYGKIGKHYFPLELTADNVDRLESIIIELRKDIDNKAGQIADLTSLIQEECATRDMLIKEYEQYIKLLGEELDEVTTMVSVHGWKSKRVEAGLTCRDRISNLKAKI